MEKEFTEVYCGSGKGKTTLAIGQCLKASAKGKSVIIIQFLKGKERRELDFLEKMEQCYEELNDQEKAEEKTNILNALNFARKVIATQECDFLLLDEILGLLDYGITTEEAIGEILKMKDESMHILLTGRTLPDSLRKYADSITTLTTELIADQKVTEE